VDDGVLRSFLEHDRARFPRERLEGVVLGLDTVDFGGVGAEHRRPEVGAEGRFDGRRVDDDRDVDPVENLADRLVVRLFEAGTEHERVAPLGERGRLADRVGREDVAGEPLGDQVRGESGDDVEGRLGRQHFRDVRSRAEGGDPGERWRTRVLDAPAEDAHEAVVAFLVGFAAGEAIEQLLHTAGSATRAKCQTVRTGDSVRPGRTSSVVFSAGRYVFSAGRQSSSATVYSGIQGGFDRSFAHANR
jgi:hypothetical protein